MVEALMSCGTETSTMRRQIGAWAAPIASSSAGLRFQVAIVDGREGARAIACSGYGCKPNTFGPPGFHQQRHRDHQTVDEHGAGDRGKPPVEPQPEPLRGEPAAAGRQDQ